MRTCAGSYASIRRSAWCVKALVAAIAGACFFGMPVARGQTSTGCSTSISHPADDCTSCGTSFTGTGGNYTVSASGANACITGGSINELTISGSNTVVRICGNTTINHIGSNLGAGNNIVISAGSTLIFSAANATSTGTHLAITNYGTLDYTGGVSNIYAVTILNIGSSAAINITGDLYLNGGTTNINMLFGGTLNITGKLSFNSQTNFICLNNNAIVNTHDLEINQPNNLHVDPSFVSCIRYTGTATVNKALTPDHLRVCQAPGATVINNNGTTGWGPDVVVIPNCGICNTGVIVPLNLLSFNATANDRNVVQLQWVTAQEINTDRFEIQSSRDGASFAVTGRVNAAGNSAAALTYEYTDTPPGSGLLYYRLKTLDKDGQYTYSPIQTVTLAAINTLRLVSSSRDNLLFYLPEVGSKAFVRLVDLQGRVLWQRDISAGQMQVNIPVSGIIAGNYFVQYSDHSKQQSKQVLAGR